LRKSAARCTADPGYSAGHDDALRFEIIEHVNPPKYAEPRDSSALTVTSSRHAGSCRRTRRLWRQ
jgi:hypothetical protein